MAFTRDITDEEAADIVLAHVQGESNRVIGKRHGRSHTTIARLLDAPDIASIVAEERGKIVAVESAQADVLREAKGREKSKRSSAKHREAVAREEFATGPTPGAPRPRPGSKRKRSADAADGAILGVFTFPAGAEGEARDPEPRWVANRVLERAQRGTTSGEELDALEARLNPEAVPLSGVRFGAFARSYDRLKDDLHVIADDLAREGLDAPRNDVIAALANCEPGNTAVLDFKLNVLEAPGDSDLRDTNEPAPARAPA